MTITLDIQNDRIADPPTIVASLPGEALPAYTLRRIRIGLIGHGVVGAAFSRLLRGAGKIAAAAAGYDLEISAALVRRARSGDASADERYELTTDLERFGKSAFDVVVDASNGDAAVLDLIARFLGRGIPVISAQKALIATHGKKLEDIAAANKTAFLYEAAVAAGVPLFSVIETSWRSRVFRRITAVLNGTSHFILDAVARGKTFSEALAEARSRGFAEADVSDDVSGRDAARKLAILVRRSFGVDIDVASIATESIADIASVDVERLLAQGWRVKPIACAEPSRAKDAVWVAPALVPQNHALAALEGVENGVWFEGTDGRTNLLAGPGAGGAATADALLDDLLAAVGDRIPSAGRRGERTIGAERKGPIGRSYWFGIETFDDRIRSDALIDVLGSFGILPRSIYSSQRSGERTTDVVSRPISRETAVAAARAIGKIAGVGRVAFLRVVDKGGEQ